MTAQAHSVRQLIKNILKENPKGLSLKAIIIRIERYGHSAEHGTMTASLTKMVRTGEVNKSEKINCGGCERPIQLYKIGKITVDPHETAAY